jgi:hypothetical protein
VARLKQLTLVLALTAGPGLVCARLRLAYSAAGLTLELILAMPAPYERPVESATSTANFEPARHNATTDTSIEL